MGILSRTNATVGIVLVGGAIGLAAPAHAEPLQGSYTATVTGTIGDYLNARVVTWAFTPCGPDCTLVDAQKAELHLADGHWTGTYTLHAVDNGDIVVCTRTVNPDNMTAADICPKPLGMIVNYQLVKNG